MGVHRRARRPRRARPALAGGPARPAYLLAALLAAAALAWSGFLLGGGAYHIEEVVFRSGHTRLVGYVVLPRERGPHPGIVFVHGAHCDTRVAALGEAKLLARHGIASLTYDKRGCGESTGSVHVPYATFAADVAAAARALAAHGEIDRRRIGLFGHSEGGWVAPLAARSIQPAFLVLQNATPLSPAEQVICESAERVRRGCFGPAVVAEVVALQRRLLAYLRGGEPGTLAAGLAAASRQPWFEAAELRSVSGRARSTPGGSRSWTSIPSPTCVPSAAPCLHSPAARTTAATRERASPPSRASSARAPARR